ncbi:DNA polymerase III subunit beta [Candidatus Kapabacteria bacterium]|nr:DNA polymerase III subunit beta [Candidatus Kapabacteria bacterium]
MIILHVLFLKNDIKRLFGKTSFAVSNDEFRPAMTGVFLQFRHNFVNAVSTDSYRLVRACYSVETNSLPEELDLIVPSKTVDLIKNADNEVQLSFISSNGKLTHLKFEIGDTIYVSRVIDEKFPPYESVIPSGNQLIALIDKSKLLDGIKFVSVSSSNISKQIKVTLSNNMLTIKGHDEDSGTDAQTEVPCEYSGDEIEIGFNYKFLEDAVSNIDADSDNVIYMTLSEPTRPALILPEAEGKDLLMLIMPVRLN